MKTWEIIGHSKHTIIDYYYYYIYQTNGRPTNRPIHLLSTNGICIISTKNNNRCYLKLFDFNFMHFLSLFWTVAHETPYIMMATVNNKTKEFAVKYLEV